MSQLFNPIGEKVEQVAPKDAQTNGENAPSAEQDEQDEPRAVEEIESLCMNCHENVDNSESTR
jgi:zinc finger protein